MNPLRKGADIPRADRRAKWSRTLDRAVQAVKARNEATPSAEIDAAIEKAVREERRRMRHQAR